MPIRFRPSRALLGVALLTVFGPLAARAQVFTPAEDGLYVVFETRLGELALKLNHAQAPVTVANFLGLAAGTIPHYTAAAPTTPVEAPFYDGIRLHRVIAGFVIQFGSPNGQGTDGPGYAFPDEIAPALEHDGTGVLSMANAGPNTNGSQVFITLAPTAHLDGKHAVFGEFVGDPAVLSAISSVPTDANNRPVTPITITATHILRRGAAAEAFDETRYAALFDPTLPEIPTPTGEGPALVEAEPTGSALELSGPRRALSTYLVEASADLAAWQAEGTASPRPDLLPDAPFAFSLPLEAATDTTFLRVRELRGRSADMAGHQPVLTLDDANSTRITYAFTGGFAGSAKLSSNDPSELAEFLFSSTPNSASEITTAIQYRLYPLAGRDQLFVVSNVARAVQCYLTWDDADSGTVFIHVLQTQTQNGFDTTGTFEFQ